MPVAKERFLSIFTSFQRDSKDLVQRIVDGSRMLTIDAGMMIYSEGDRCEGIAFVLEGTIRVFKTGESGHEITLYEINPGESCVLNASCLLSSVAYPANAVSLTRVELLLLPKALFEEMITDSAVMRDFVFSLLSERLVVMMSLIEEVAFSRLDERLLEYLKERAEQGSLDTTHQRIAQDLGTSREVVSRILKHFEHAGKLRLSRNRIELVVS